MQRGVPMVNFGLPFWIFFFVGAVTLWLEAHRLFHDPQLGLVLSKGRFPRLSGVGYDQLSTARMYNRGYFFYVATFLIIYAVCVFSIEVAEVWLKSSSSVRQNGGQGALPFVNSTGTLVTGGADPWPLAVALAMISFLSARNQAGKTLRSVEMMFRNLAHRLAGIPNSIYRLVTRLGRVDFSKAIEGSDAPYLSMFDGAFNRMAAGGGNAAVTQQRLEIARNDFKAIDALEPAVCGAFQDSVFPIENTETMVRLLKEQTKECEALHKILQKALDEREPLPTLEDMRAIAVAGRDCLRNLKALFAVLYSQTDADDIGSIHPPITRVLQELKAPDRFFLKDKVVVSAILTTFLICLFYPAWRLYGFYSEGRHEDRTMMEVFAKDFGFVMQRTAEDILPIAFLFVLVSLATLSIRRNHIDTEDWTDWGLVNIPITRLLKTVAFPSLFAALGGAAMALGLKVLFTFLSDSLSAAILINQIMIPLFPVFVTYILLGICIGVASLVVADQHLKMPCWRTVTTAAFFFLPFLFVALVGKFLTTTGRPEENAPNYDSAMALYAKILESNMLAGVFQSLFALAFLALFAFLVEQAEDDARSDMAGGTAPLPGADDLGRPLAMDQPL